MRPSKLTVFCKIFLSVVAINIVLANEERSIENKDPKKAFYCSLIPGMGQLYNGKLIKSAIFVGLEISAYVAWKDNSGKYNSYDAVVDAHLNSFDTLMESPLNKIQKQGKENE